MRYAKLRGKIVENFRTLSAFSVAFDMDMATLSARLNSRSQWKADEIAKACDILEIPLSEAHLYFFCNESCENATK